MATFTPTSNQELDAVLGDWRKNVFLPSILSKHHQDLIFKTKHQDVLLNPPGVTATVATSIPPHADRSKFEQEEKIKLMPLPRNEFDKGTGFKVIANSLAGDSSLTTWDNLIPFLDGLRQAKIAPSNAWIETICRKANMQNAGRWNTLVEAAVQVKRTGFTLSMIDATRELIYGALSRAVKSDFQETEPLALVAKVGLLMEKEEHCGGKIPGVVKQGRLVYADMRRDPVSIATRLALLSAAAVRNEGGKDTTGAVAADVAKLIAFNHATPTGLHDSIKNAYNSPDAVVPNVHFQHQRELQDLTTLYCGLALASKVDLRPTLSKEKNVKTSIEVQKLLQNIKPKLTNLKQKVEDFKTSKAKDGKTPPVVRSLVFLSEVEEALQSI